MAQPAASRRKRPGDRHEQGRDGRGGRTAGDDDERRHSAGDWNAEAGVPLYLGEPAGFVVELENGYRFYHAGDTDVFGDMRLIGELHRPDIALLPIGGHYTMGPREAAKAVELLGVKHVIPIHYGTFPLLSGTPDQLRASLAERGLGDVTVYALEPGGLARVKAPAAATAAVS